jgi:hypothetical protein
MRRRLAASVLALTLTFSVAPLAEAAGWREALDFRSWLVSFWAWAGAPAAPLESAGLAGGVCGDPHGWETPPGPSCPVPPPAPAMESEGLADGACSDPDGRQTPPGPSCPVPPAPALATEDDPDF